MKGKILLGILALQTTPTFTNGININNTEKQIVENFSETGKIKDTTYQVSKNEFIEVLQGNIKQKIIRGVINYFDNDVTFKLTQNEKKNLTNDVSDFLNKYPNIITTDGNHVFLNIDNTSFRALFKTLLPYLGKGKELSKYSFLINNTGTWAINKILKHIENSQGEEAEKYFFHQFGYMIMEIVMETQGDMTIGEYINSMKKGIYIESIVNKKYSEDLLNDSVKNLPKYF